MIKSNPGVRKKNDNFSARKPSPFPGDHRSDLSAGGHTGRHARPGCRADQDGRAFIPCRSNSNGSAASTRRPRPRRRAATSSYVFSENVANTDYERVMREYAEAGIKLIIGEVFGVEREAREVAADYPDVAFLMGSTFKRRCRTAELRGVRQLHPGCVLPVRHHRRRDDQVEQYRHGRRLPDPRGQPPDARLHGRCARDEPGRQVPGHLHRLLVRSAQGQGNRLRA